MTGPPLWLLFGIAVDPDEVRDRLAADGARASDYLANRIPSSERQRGFRPDAEWLRRLDRHVCRHLGDLARTAGRLGVEVRRRATIDDLCEAAAHGEIIIVFSHWKGAAFANDDFLPGFDRAVHDRLAGRDHPLASWALAELAPNVRYGFWKKPPPSARDVFRQALAAKIPQPAVADGDVEQRSTTAARRRELLDAWLHPYLVAGNRLELFDGMHSKEDVAAAVTDFRGLIDFTICQSTFLGDHVGAASGQEIRTVQFLHLQEPIDAALRLRVILTHLAQTEISWRNYQRIRKMAEAVLAEEVAFR